MGVDEWVRDVDTDIGNIIREMNKGPRFVQATTVQRDSLTTLFPGLILFNTTTKKLNMYNGLAWEAVQSI